MSLFLSIYLAFTGFHCSKLENLQSVLMLDDTFDDNMLTAKLLSLNQKHQVVPGK